MFYNADWKIKGEKDAYRGVIELNTPLIHIVEKEFKNENPFDIKILKIETSL